MPSRYWIETLGCPKNAVDSEKIAGSLDLDGYERAADPESADLVVVNTCAFIDAAREESIETILELSEVKRRGARLVVTGCLAARSGEELAAALPEVDLVADLGVPVQLKSTKRFAPADAETALSLMELPRPAAGAPWAYVRVAEGCDRACGFCAIPAFRGPQRSRSKAAILREIDELGVAEVILVAQDLASYGRDLSDGVGLVELVEAVAERAARVRLLYLYPSMLTDRLIVTMRDAGVSYFDLSLQHASAPQLRRMRRWGSRQRFHDRIERIRELAPGAALRSSFIVGYPGETEEDHDELLSFLADEQLDWVGLFAYSEEEGTYAVGLEDKVARSLALERLREASAIAEEITAKKRNALVGTVCNVLVDAPGAARSYREAPEIDGVVRVPEILRPGTFADVVITAAEGPDLLAEVLATTLEVDR